MLSISIDIGTLFVIAISVTVLHGLFLLFAWRQERIEALGWSPTPRSSGTANGVRQDFLAALLRSTLPWPQRPDFSADKKVPRGAAH